MACCLALLTAVIALRGFQALRATTMGAPCLWAAIAAVSLAIGFLIESRLEGITLSATRFALATTAFCPLMAVLGAKRPQHRGWQWIVLSLWVILVWPAAQAVVLPVGVRVELFAAWKIFLWALIALGLLNYLPTRHWRATILVALGQILLLREYLDLPAAESIPINDLVAVLCFLSAAAIIASVRLPSDPNQTFPTSDLSPLTARWFRFRNLYGAFWAMRIFGRMNLSAEQRSWPVRLDWSGFTCSTDAEPSPEQLTEIERSLDSMLRRFLEEKTIPPQ